MAPGAAQPARTEGLLDRRGWERLASLIVRELGIKMPDSKVTMVEARMLKRMRELGIPDAPAYLGYLFSPEGTRDELLHFLDAMTTNKTDFFREPDHFSHLASRLLPRWSQGRAATPARPFAVWSAGCSTGEEPYSIAMVLAEHARATAAFDFTILATDVASKVIGKGIRAVYGVEDAAGVPEDLRRRYLLRSRDRAKDLVRIVPELRAKVRFARLNLMDPEYRGIPGGMDAVFCRNVLIYFDRENQRAILGRLIDRLAEGGHLFIGHSENILGFDLPLTPVAPMVYRLSRRGGTP